MQGIKDEEIRTSLIASQRRWLKAREDLLDSMTQWNDGQDAPDADGRHAVLREATRQRSKVLNARSEGQPTFVVYALEQRKLASVYSGGPYAGYQVSCFFIPATMHDLSRWTYNCFGSRTYQNANRICSEDNDFASFTTQTTRDVSIIENGKRKSIASCAVGTDNDSLCPDGRVDADSMARWNIKVDEGIPIATGMKRLPKIDPDLAGEDDDDRGWMHTCLTNANFPRANPAADHSNDK